jgi:hypothetical protein
LEERVIFAFKVEEKVSAEDGHMFLKTLAGYQWTA